MRMYKNQKLKRGQLKRVKEEQWLGRLVFSCTQRWMNRTERRHSLSLRPSPHAKK